MCIRDRALPYNHRITPSRIQSLSFCQKFCWSAPPPFLTLPLSDWLFLSYRSFSDVCQHPGHIRLLGYPHAVSLPLIALFDKRNPYTSMQFPLSYPLHYFFHLRFAFVDLPFFETFLIIAIFQKNTCLLYTSRCV